MMSELRKARLARDVHERSKLGAYEVIFLKARLAKKRAEFQGVLLNPMWQRFDLLREPISILEAAE